jgi:hypothetical protein
LFAFALGDAFMLAYVYSRSDFHHTEAPLVIALGILALSPAGRVLSVGQLIRRWRDGNHEMKDVLTAEGPLAGWPLRLIQWLFVLIYLSAVLSKLVFGSLEWLNGYTLQYFLIQDTLRKGTLLGGWFSQYHYLVMLSQYAVVLFQTTFVLAAIFPRLRWIYVPLGLGFHAGNWILLNAPFPEWMALYAVFIPWQRVFRHDDATGSPRQERSSTRDLKPAGRLWRRRGLIRAGGGRCYSCDGTNGLPTALPRWSKHESRSRCATARCVAGFGPGPRRCLAGI